MSKMKLSNGVTYPIADYATQNSFVVLLGSMTVSEVLESLTEENLSMIEFLTDSGAITGTYYNKLLYGYTDNCTTLAVRINDADLCRYGLVLDEDNRIIYAPAQRYAPKNAIIVDKLPEGNLPDYMYLNGKYVYEPLPHSKPPAQTLEDRVEVLETDAVETREALKMILSGVTE